MSLHDDYARRTPYERFLPDPGFPGRHFSRIADEARTKGIALDDPGAFALLEAAAEALEEVRSGDDEAESLPRHALLLFHAFHHHAAATPLYLLTTGVVRTLADTEPWSLPLGVGEDPVPRSVYLQFPQHLVWARAEGEAPPTSLDGAFRTTTDDGRIHVLPVGGLLGDRAGFTVLPVPGVPAAHEGQWLAEEMRPGGGDFSSKMPGADVERLYEVHNVGEALKIVARAIAYVRRFPNAVQPCAPELAAASTPAPSELPAWRVGLEGSDG